MSRLSVSVKIIKTKEDFENVDRHMSGKVQLIRRFTENGETASSAWEKRKEETRPGITKDGGKALEAEFSLENGTGKENIKEFAKAVTIEAGNLFGKDNILSSVFSASDHISSVILFLFPLPEKSRQLKPEAWLNERKKEYFNRDITKAFEEELKKTFPDLLVTGEQTGAFDPVKEGYQPALINFKTPEYLDDVDEILTYITQENSDGEQTDKPFDEIRKIERFVLSYYTTGPEHLLYESVMRPGSEIAPADYMNSIDAYLRSHYTLTDNDRVTIEENIFNAVFKLYVLEPLVNDPSVSDIKVLAPDDIRIKRYGKRYTSNLKFIDENDYERFIDSIAKRHGLDIHSNGINIFSDITSSDVCRMRCNITTPQINTVRWPYFYIRKIPKDKTDMKKLIKAGMLDEHIRDYLIDRARNGPGMVFCGKGASGKTTLMNCLLDYIPYSKSGLVIQEAEELFSDKHPDLMFQTVTTMTDRNQGKVYTLEDLARNGLLIDLDYFIIGEIKGAEAQYFLNAADTGHQCWCSVHAPSSLDAIDKLADYVMYKTKYSKDEATYMLKSLGTVIFMKNFKVCEISEIAGWDPDKRRLIYTPVYKRPGIENKQE